MSASGSGNAAVFAAIFEKVPGRFTARHNLNADQFAAANAADARPGYAHGAERLRHRQRPALHRGLVAGPGYLDRHDGPQPAGAHQEFLTRTSNGEKPSLITVGPGNTYTAVWVKDDGTMWREFTDMSSAGYQNRFNAMKERGFLPVKLDAEEGRYGAIWARRLIFRESIPGRAAVPASVRRRGLPTLRADPFRRRRRMRTGEALPVAGITPAGLTSRTQSRDPGLAFSTQSRSPRSRVRHGSRRTGVRQRMRRRSAGSIWTLRPASGGTMTSWVAATSPALSVASTGTVRLTTASAIGPSS